MRILSWFKNMTLKKKLFVLFTLVGLVPLIITFFISYGELRKSVLSSQNYAANQNFEQTLVTMTNKLSQIEKVSTMIIVNKDIHSLFSRKPEDMQVWEQISAFENISSYTQILEMNAEFNKIIYYVNDRFVVTGPNAPYRPVSRVEDTKWVQKIYANGGSSTWVIQEEDHVRTPQSYLTLGRVLWSKENYMSSVGLVAINVDLKQIRQSLPGSSSDQLTYIQTEDGEIVASSGETELEAMRLPKLMDSSNNFREVRLEGGVYSARSQQIGTTNLYLTSVISQRAASEAVNKVGSQMITVYLIISVVLMFLIFPITKSITYRVSLLMNKMSQVRQGRLNTLDIAPSEDEVGQLVSSYNYMINSVQELLGEQYTLGQEIKGAELKALQSQINPHFLYNTLDMLIWMAQKDETENIQQVIYALSDYYKLTLNKGEDFVPIEDELRLCSIYVEIQQKRFKDRIKFEMDVEDEVKECLLPKITLQPLIENAIIHGIREKPDGRGKIVIKGEIQGHRMILTVEDDGIGIKDEAHKREGYHGSGYGVHNIAKRLDLYFGQKNSMRFESTEGVGTCVVIDIPVVKR